MNEKTTNTPIMRQYNRAKAECPPGTILLFKIGDFYEMFNGDAHAAAGILGLTLTLRNGMPMCGVPYHYAGKAIEKILAADRPVAICDELEEPGTTRGAIHRREVTRTFLPEKARCERMRDQLAELTDANNHAEAAYEVADFFKHLFDEKEFDGLNPFLVLRDAIMEIWLERDRKHGLAPLLSSACCGLQATVCDLARTVFPEQAAIVLEGL